MWYFGGEDTKEKGKRMSKWYFGGIAVTCAGMCTHPLDTIKTILQTPHPTVCVNPHFKSRFTGATLHDQKSPLMAVASKLHRYRAEDGTVKFKEMGFVRQTVVIVRTQGIRSLYNGLPALMLWTITSATMRFGVYELLKQRKCPRGEKVLFYQRVYMAMCGGVCGGIVGNPFDTVKTRMQNDIKLPGRLYRDRPRHIHF